MSYEQFTGTRPVADAHRFDEAALLRYLREHIDGFGPDLAVEMFKGGQSNPTFLLKSGGRRYVLRRKPPGVLLPSAHAVDREFRVISALNATDVPVAKAYALCEDDSVIGTMFYVMDYVSGSSLDALITKERKPVDEVLKLFIEICDAVSSSSVRLNARTPPYAEIGSASNASR